MKYLLVIVLAIMAVQVTVLLSPEEIPVRPKVEVEMPMSESDPYPKIPKSIKVDGQLVWSRSENGAVTIGPTRVGPNGEPLGADIKIGGALKFDGDLVIENSEKGLYIRGDDGKGN